MPTLADIYSYIDTQKRKAAGAIRSPLSTLQEVAALAGDEARQINRETALSSLGRRQEIAGQPMSLEQQAARQSLLDRAGEAAVGVAGTTATGKLLSKYPLAPAGERYEETAHKIKEMSPIEFLRSVKKLEIDESSRDNIEYLKEHMLKGGKLDPLIIRANGKEDGRHRAVAAMELGIKKVPVVDYRAK